MFNAAGLWVGPTGAMRPTVLGLSHELGRSSDSVVLLEGARVYRHGFVMRIAVVVSEAVEADGPYLFDQLELRHHPAGSSPAALSLEIDFGEAGRASTRDVGPWTDLPEGLEPADWTPIRPFIEGLGRPVRYADIWSRELWVWPLPSREPITVACEWTARGVDRTITTMDAALFEEAAARVRPLWAR